jgi:hypothetical protein
MAVLETESGTEGKVNKAGEGEELRDNGVDGEREIEREDGPILYGRLRQEWTVDGRHACSLPGPQIA